MTPAQAEWLRKLKDEGPHRHVRHEWMQMRRTKQSAFIVWGPEGYGMSPLDAPPDAVWLARITPAGLAALEAHERGTP